MFPGFSGHTAVALVLAAGHFDDGLFTAVRAAHLARRLLEPLQNLGLIAITQRVRDAALIARAGIRAGLAAPLAKQARRRRKRPLKLDLVLVVVFVDAFLLYGARPRVQVCLEVMARPLWLLSGRERSIPGAVPCPAPQGAARHPVRDQRDRDDGEHSVRS